MEKVKEIILVTAFALQVLSIYNERWGVGIVSDNGKDLVLRSGLTMTIVNSQNSNNILPKSTYLPPDDTEDPTYPSNSLYMIRFLSVLSMLFVLMLISMPPHIIQPYKAALLLSAGIMNILASGIWYVKLRELGKVQLALGSSFIENTLAGLILVYLGGSVLLNFFN